MLTATHPKGPKAAKSQSDQLIVDQLFSAVKSINHSILNSLKKFDLFSIRPCAGHKSDFF